MGRGKGNKGDVINGLCSVSSIAGVFFFGVHLFYILSSDSCVTLLHSKICRGESSEAAVSINILGPGSDACGEPGASDV